MSKKGGVSVRIESDDERVDPPPPPGSTTIPDAGYDPIRQPLFADFAHPDVVAFVRVRRIVPRDPPLGGAMGDLPADCDEQALQELAGGGTYECTAIGPTGRALAQKPVRIAGHPRIPRDTYAGPNGQAPAASTGIEKVLDRFLDAQSKAADNAAVEHTRRMDEKDKDFQRFYAMLKAENTSTLQTVMGAVSEATKTTVAAVTQLANGSMELAKAQIGKASGLGDLAQMAELVGKLKGGGTDGDMPPWMMMAMMMAPQYMPPPGTPQWYFAQGKKPPPELMEAMARGAMPGAAGMLGATPPVPASRPTPAAERGTTPANPADHPIPDEELDEVAKFFEYVDLTPDDLLPWALASLARAKRIPARVVAAIDALQKGDEAPAAALLTEYDSVDLAPRLKAALEALHKQAASAAPAPGAA